MQHITDVSKQGVSSYAQRAIVAVVVISLLTITITGCSSGRRTGALGGVGAGAGLGAIISGGGAPGILIGAALGSLVGSEIGRRLDERDRQQISHHLEHSESGDTKEWVNSDTNTKYSMTPHEAYESDNGEPCRDFVLVTENDGTIETTACRRDDGRWYEVS